MSASPQSGILKRALGNAGMLLSGKATAGIMQLATFALAARGLGMTEFGYFSILLAQVMLLVGIAAFESNQAVIRYGVSHLNARNAPDFQALVKAGTLLDLGAATLATLTVILIAPIVGKALGWDDRIIFYAQMIAPLAYGNAFSTAKGMLRLFGRFDLLTAHSVVTPAIRLLGVAAAWATGASLWVYLLAWLVAGWAGVACAIFLGWREASRTGLLKGFGASLAHLPDWQSGVWRFSLFTNLNASLALIPTQLATFLTGAIVSAEAAGLFKVALEIGTGLMKPVDLVNQALYPDLARLAAASQWQRLRNAAVRAGLIAGAAGLAVTLLVLVAGRPILIAIFGSAFGAAAPLLVALSFATTLRVVAFPADPLLYALNHPNVPFRNAVIANLIFLAMLLWGLQRHDLMGACWAYLAFGLTAGLLAGLSAAHLLARARRGSGNL